MLGSGYFFIRGYNGSKFNALISGLIMGLTPWVQQKALLFPILFIFFMLITRFWNNNNKIIPIVWFTSFLLSLLSPVIWLLHNNIFGLWFTQTFADPLKLFYSNSVVAYMSIYDMGIRSAVFLLMTIICITFSLIVNFINRIKLVRIREITYLSGMLIFICLPFAGIIGRIDTSKNLDIKNWLILVSSWLPNMLWYFGFSAVLIICLVLIYEKVKLNFNKVTFKDKQNYFLSAPLIGIFFISMGLSSVLFLYPNFGYFWWFAPISIVSLIMIIEKFNFESVWVVRCAEAVFTKRLLITLIACGLALFFIANLQQKFHYSDPKLKHMTEFSNDELKFKEAELKFVQKINPGHLRMNECLDIFLLTTLPKNYSFDRYFGPLPIRDLSTDKNNFLSENIVTCSIENNSSAYIQMGYHEVSKELLKDGRYIVWWKK
jgi:hypothetical protein